MDICPGYVTPKWRHCKFQKHFFIWFIDIEVVYLYSSPLHGSLASSVCSSFLKMFSEDDKRNVDLDGKNPGSRALYLEKKQGWGSRIFSTDPDPTWNRNEEKNIFIFQVGRDKTRYYNPSFYAWICWFWFLFCSR